MDTAQDVTPAVPVDGTTIRPVTSEDLDAIVDLHQRLGSLTVRCRLMTSHPDLSPERLAQLTDVDGHDRVTFVAAVTGSDRLTGLGRYVRRSACDTADVVLLADDEGQAGDVELPLLRRLADHARSQGVDTLQLEVLPLDQALIDRLGRSGMKVRRHLHSGAVTLTFPLEPARTYVPPASALRPWRPADTGRRMGL